jgi:hypothetical protein
LKRGSPGVDFTECQTEGPRKGRQEMRTCCAITNPKGIRNVGLWTGLTAICLVISERVVKPRPPLLSRPPEMQAKKPETRSDGLTV